MAGGTGHLGSRVVRKLLTEGIPAQNIRILYYPESLTTALEGLPVDLYPLDILDKASLLKALGGFNYVFHHIGNTAMDNKTKKIQWLVNVEGTRNLLEACLENGIERIIYTSTVNTLGCPFPKGALGNEKTSPYVCDRPEIGKEVPKLHKFDSPEECLEFADAVHDGTGPKKWWKKIKIGYYDSKLAAQEIVNRFHQEEGLSIISILPGTLFGPGDDLIGNGLYLLRVQTNSMPGYIKGGGFALTHVDDEANGHYLAMLKGKAGERYIITGLEEDNRYLKEALKIIADIVQEREPERKIRIPSLGFGYRTAWFFGALLDIISVFKKRPFPIGRDVVLAGSYPSFFSYRKAERAIGYSPTKTFQQAIEETYDYYQEKNYLGIKERIGLIHKDTTKN
ncbi:MAG: NAD-dependent epimerase/dehydratase family protein [Candidatus Helarchaeota archaeon]|nr:NAD-dependent epimerase/dehydratase family protein [Candidatus Helarchaeota archaeon]